jgi:hypothetical protein
MVSLLPEPRSHAYGAGGVGYYVEEKCGLFEIGGSPRKRESLSGWLVSQGCSLSWYRAT